MTWAADVVDVERYSKVEICFLGLARKRLLFLLRQEERVIDGNRPKSRPGPQGRGFRRDGRQEDSKIF